MRYAKKLTVHTCQKMESCIDPILKKGLNMNVKLNLQAKLRNYDCKETVRNSIVVIVTSHFKYTLLHMLL